MNKFDKEEARKKRIAEIDAAVGARRAKLAQWERERDAAHARGYRAMPAQIKAQLDDLLDAGDISQQEYNWGIVGIQVCVDVGIVEDEIPI